MQGTYSPGLIALSIVVAILVSYTALKLAARVATKTTGHRFAWLCAGACAMGIGIWSMHFIGMLAFSLPIRLTYDMGITFGSLAIAILTSGFALAIASREDLSLARLSLSSLVMGAGIAGMHYSGMGAIRVMPMIAYEPSLLIASIGVAVAASFAALWLAFRLRSGDSWKISLARLAAAIVMGFAITGMHYTGMAASMFSLGSYCVGGVPLDNGMIPIVIGILSLAILAIALLTSLYDAHLQTKTIAHLQSLEQANALLQHQALHDALTGLPNRLLLEDRLEQAIAGAERDGTMVAVIAVDLDRFKSINDSLGHPAGDALLKEAANRLKGALRANDTVARVGGDEFVIVLPSVTRTFEVEALARTLLAELSAPFDVLSTRLHTSGSLGICFFPQDGRDAASLIAHSDEAMYHAKQGGRGGYQCFSPEMSVFTPERLLLENDLRQALALNQFEVHYQPKVDAARGNIVGVEALLRWRHPTRGLVSPAEFVPLAEETGLILNMGEWVLREACRQARAWQLSGLEFVRVAVNLSAKQFRQKDLVGLVKSALDEAQLPPHLLELELTESSVMSDSENSAAILEQLSRLGVLISIDDFGTGYSNMSYLRRFPIDKLKIDRSFIRDISSSPDGLSIVRAIVSLTHSLRLKAIAEGVETPDQLEAIRELGCDQYQGYLFSTPLTAEAIEELMREHSPHAPLDMMRTYSKLSAFVPRRAEAS
jgi:diguanylate cyclase (GGDEF)-like protein